ncbi:MAG: IPT/TIG domain-containing protein [Chitinophagaceae bacterium]
MRSILNKNFCFLLLSCWLFTTLLSCQKNFGFQQPLPLIHHISPVSGKFGIQDTISGANFNPDPLKNQVTFNGVPAKVIFSNDSMLVALIPEGAETGPVQVIADGHRIQGPIFHYIYTVTVSTLAGNGLGGFANGNGSSAQFNLPRGIAVDEKGNIFVADFGNFMIRKISPDGTVSTFAGSGVQGHLDGLGNLAEFNGPSRLTFDQTGNLFVTDYPNIRKITPDGMVTTFAGDGQNGYRNGSASTAEFNFPFGITSDGRGNLYITDINNNNIRKIDSLGQVSTMAGGNPGYADGIGNQAQFNFPAGIAEQQGELLITDGNNFRIRTLTVNGEVGTLAGDGHFGDLDGPVYLAEFEFPSGIACDGKGNIYVCGQEDKIRMITSLGQVITIAGDGINGFNNGPGEVAEFNQPLDLALDQQGNLYVADHMNQCIRKVVIK